MKITDLFDMKRWLEGPESLNKQVQQVLVQGTQKPGTTVEDYRKDPNLYSTIRIHQQRSYLRIVFGKIMCTLCRSANLK